MINTDARITNAECQIYFYAKIERKDRSLTRSMIGRYLVKRSNWVLLVLAIVLPLVILINLFVHSDIVAPILIGLLTFASVRFFNYLNRKGWLKKRR